MVVLRSMAVCVWMCLCAPLTAVAVDLGMPVICNYGVDCFITTYMDHKIDEEAVEPVDYTCGSLTLEGYGSTDFNLKSYSMIEEGAEVVAADTGVVTNTRDTMVDVSHTLLGDEAIRGRECGNGVVLEHKRGYVTQYCHLRQDSVEVEIGQKVEKGSILGYIGLSGSTSSPKLQFTVLHNGSEVDPFTGQNPIADHKKYPCGSIGTYPLWDKKTERALKYIPTALLDSGFSRSVPYAQGVREGKFKRDYIPASSKIMAFWIELYGILDGDSLQLSLVGPDGKVILEDQRQFSETKQRHFQFMGDNRQEWKPGIYEGKVVLIRDKIGIKEKIIDLTRTIEVK